MAETLASHLATCEIDNGPESMVTSYGDGQLTTPSAMGAEQQKAE
jgi:hypothetical protein